jgi:hypothetical protein
MPNVDFPRVFLLMHKWFMESDVLANMLYDIYVKYDEQNNSSNSRNVLLDYQFKICYTFRYWIKKFPFHFALDMTLADSVRQFSSLIISKGYKDQLKLLDTSNM